MMPTGARASQRLFGLRLGHRGGLRVARAPQTTERLRGRQRSTRGASARFDGIVAAETTAEATAAGGG